MQLISILVLLRYSSCSVTSPHFSLFSLSFIVETHKIRFPKCRIQITVHTKQRLYLYIAKCIRRNYIFRVFFFYSSVWKKECEKYRTTKRKCRQIEWKKISCRVCRYYIDHWNEYDDIIVCVCVLCAFVRVECCELQQKKKLKFSFQKTGGGIRIISKMHSAPNMSDFEHTTNLEIQEITWK